MLLATQLCLMITLIREHEMEIQRGENYLSRVTQRMELVPEPGYVGHKLGSRLPPRSETARLEPDLHLGKTRGWMTLLLSMGRQGLFVVPECPLLAVDQTVGLGTSWDRKEGWAWGLRRQALG